MHLYTFDEKNDRTCCTLISKLVRYRKSCSNDNWYDLHSLDYTVFLIEHRIDGDCVSKSYIFL